MGCPPPFFLFGFAGRGTLRGRTLRHLLSETGRRHPPFFFSFHHPFFLGRGCVQIERELKLLNLQCASFVFFFCSEEKVIRISKLQKTKNKNQKTENKKQEFTSLFFFFFFFFFDTLNCCLGKYTDIKKH